ncbi:MAG: NosD domain-containing protein [Candidatus Thorarchaeota archaeon]
MFDPTAGLPEDIASDLGYFAIDGLDYIPDYIYGRISVDDATQAGIVVDKILQYEQSPPTLEDFYTDILTAGKFEDIMHTGIEDPSFPFVYDLERIRYYLDFYRDYDVTNVYSCTGTSPEDAADEWFMPLEFYTTLLNIDSNLIEDSDLQYTIDQPPEYEIYDWLSAYHEYGNMESGAQRIADEINLGKFLALYYGHGGSGNMVYRYDTNGNLVWDIDDRDQVDGWLTPYFSINDLSRLDYQMDTTPLFISMACNTGWYDGEVDQGWLDLDEYYQPGYGSQDGALMPVDQSIVNPFLEESLECFAEEITRLDGGAIAAISSSRLAYSIISGYLLDGIIDALWPGLFECQEGNLELGDEPLRYPIHNMGATLLLGKLIAAQQWGVLHDEFEVAQTTFEGYLLFGDPETKLWTEKPTEIDVSYPASIGTTEHQRFAVTVTDSISGDAVKYAKVCLHQEGDDGPIVYEVGYTDANGQAVFDIDPGIPATVPGDPHVDVTVTKDNVRPHIGTIDVISSSASISLSPQFAEGGEIVTISFSGFGWDANKAIIVDGNLIENNWPFSLPQYPLTVPSGETRYMNIRVIGWDGTYGVSVDCFQRLGAPDLYLYSQDDQSTWDGRGLTWDNPDIEIYRDGEQQLRLEQYEENTVKLTVHNRGSFGTGQVCVYYAPFGDASTWMPIGPNLTVNLDYGQSTTVEWTFTPTLPSTCLKGVIFTFVDPMGEAFAGYECLGYVEMSTTGELSFDVVNPTDEPFYATFNIKQLGDYGGDVWSATILDYSPQLIAPDESGTFRLYIDTMSSPAGLGRDFEVEVTTCKGKSLGGMIFNATEYTDVQPEGTPTPEGPNIPVPIPDSGITMTFDFVTEAGVTSVEETGAPPGATESPAGGNAFFDITTTATFTGYVTIAIQYDENDYTNEQNLEIMHWDSGTSKWAKVTTSLDTTANIIECVVDSFSTFALMEMTPIYIDDDGDFAAYGFPGDGVTEPYRIENYLFVGSEELIHIQYTTKSFIITGCQLDGEDGTHNGITLLNVIVGEIFDNDIENCFTGIHIEGCSNIWVEANDCSGNRAGIYLSNSNGNDVVHNTCNNNYYSGIQLDNSHVNDVLENTCNGNGDAGILLRVSNNNEVIENICEHNSYAGIYLDQANGNNVIGNTCNYNTIHGIHVLWSESNTIANNSCSGSDHYGIRVEFSNNNIVVYNTCSSNTIVGIELSDSYYNTVASNTCNNQDLGINIILDSSHNEILENTCTDDTGINLISSDLNVVSDNDCSGSIIGISIGDSNNNQVIGNDCSECELYGIILDTCTSSVLISNTCNENEIGIYLYDSHENEIIGNTCYYNDQFGILLNESNLNLISGNDCSDNWLGMYLYNSDECYVVDNICNYNFLDGIYLSGVEHNTVERNTCNENERRGITLNNSHNNIIIDNSFNDNGYNGIHLFSSNYNTLSANTCEGNGISEYKNGIYLEYSNENEIAGNICNLNSYMGILLNGSSQNVVTGNTCVGNGWFGIFLSNSNLNDIFWNTCDDNVYVGIYLGNSWENSVNWNVCNYNDLDGIYLSESGHNTVEGNTCVENERRGIAIRNSHNNIVLYNYFNENGEHGIIIFGGSTNNEIADNTLNLNEFGVGIENSDSNVVKYNTIAGNQYGFYLTGSSSNLFYYNKITDNTIQAFDDNPSGNDWYNPSMLKGNYWSDYPGEDLDGDGVGDTDVAWPGPGFDMYPLMIDSDNDGLPDSVELSIGTNPADPDTDKDEWRDGDEYYYLFTDPLKRDSSWPTVSGNPLFTLHILASSDSEIAMMRAEYLARDLRCIGIEVVIHPLPWLQWIPTLTDPEAYGLSRPTLPGEPIWDNDKQIYVGFDLAILGLQSNGYISGLDLASINDNLNQGYYNQEYEDLLTQLQGFNIDWNANWPDPPDLSGEALDILHQLQEIWAQDQPFWVMWGRDHWDVGSDETGWAITLPNHGNEHLAIQEVRQAVNLVMWRQLMIHAGLTGHWQIHLVQTPTLPAFPGYDSASDAYRNVLLARVLLYNAGYTDIIIDSDHDGWSDYDEVYTIFTDPHEPGPFFIDGDAELATMAGWLGWDGDGSEEHPYIIQNYYIDVNGADASCIKIQNIFDTYFIIRDCTVTGTSVPEGGLEIPFDDAYAGIWLSNVRYAEVTNNYCFGNCYGIRVDYSYAVTIADNHCYSNDWEGIAVLLDSTQCVVTDNYCFDNDGLLGNGIGIGVGAYHNQIVHNFVYNNLGDEGAGIHIFLGYDNTIIDNDCYGNYWGIAVRGTSSDNDILENHCWDNFMGIYIQNSDSNIIADNDCFLNSFEGIAVNGDSSGNLVTDNECYDNLFNGIGVGAWATGNTVEYNLAYNNGEAGIHFWLGFDTIVRENECYGNYWGISLRGESTGNHILDNLCSDNYVGIYLWTSDFNVIANNTCLNSESGAIELHNGSDNNLVQNNYCQDSILTEIYVADSFYNTIEDNTCVGGWGGVQIRRSSYNTLENNTCLNGEKSGIYLKQATENEILNNFCQGNVLGGIYLDISSSSNILEGNELTGNLGPGIYLYLSDDNTIYDNLVFGNGIGISLSESNRNLIFHNQIIDNDEQASDTGSIDGNSWYHPVLLEGNIWSDYIGVDFDRDGIGDTDIPWPGEGFDMYPLVTDDFDNDGLSYYAELEIGTDPYNDDSDGDYFKDGDEWRYFFSDPTVAETPAQVSEVVDESLEELVEEEVLEEKDINPLLKKLDAARALMDKGKLFQATQKLGDFIDQINSMVNKGKLTEEEGNELIALAQALIDVILTM